MNIVTFKHSHIKQKTKVPVVFYHKNLSKRNNFDFYECEYCHESGKIKQVKIDISI